MAARYRSPETAAIVDDVATVATPDEPPVRTSAKLADPRFSGWNSATTLLFEFITRVVGLIDPDKSPLHALKT